MGLFEFDQMQVKPMSKFTNIHKLWKEQNFYKKWKEALKNLNLYPRVKLYVVSSGNEDKTSVYE